MGEPFGQKIDVRPLFEHDRSVLLALLRELGPADWERPTAAAPWTVRDLVSHMLGDDLNRLSRTRDAHSGEGPRPGEDLPAFIHRINDEWVGATRRTSPAVLTSLLEATSPQILAMWRSLDLDALGEPVTWAGPDPAPVWLDCARDFTEYWGHQQQIRDATGRAGLGGDPVVRGVLHTFLLALPHTLAGHDGAEGTTLSVVVEGPGRGAWSWRHTAGRWRGLPPIADASTVLT
ncbi:MAG TPA: maleylpyruvate isomerase family mycothiol-dependent enzyme, partial [Pseudonocardia sp.]|nr:maleylpyruvate isomerase family mycothiol-dependent enzyme [Pseudonocardia sp.]